MPKLSWNYLAATPKNAENLYCGFVTEMTIKQAQRIGLKQLNWSQKLALAKKYAWDRLYHPQPFSLTEKSLLGGFNNLDRIVADILDN
jgi:hemolysin activation/secretion protein